MASIANVSEIPNGEAPVPPQNESIVETPLRDKIKQIVAYALIVLGILFIAVTLGMFVGHGIGYCVTDVTVAQALFMCGLSAALGGFTLQNSEFKGELALTPPGMPFKYTISAAQK